MARDWGTWRPGPGIGAVRLLRASDIVLDVAAFGLPLADDMPGRLIAPAFDPAFRASGSLADEIL
jgi:hypothetical protein